MRTLAELVELYSCTRVARERVVAPLRAAGFVAYLVGGCVRDLLLGRAPKEADIATSATPDEIERVFERTVPVGRQFGVVRVRVPAGAGEVGGDGEPTLREFEVATFRSECDYFDGRRPAQVTFADAEADSRRRDFTINGLFLDPLDDEGRVIDFVGGRADLDARVIRAIDDPSERFGEDRLRLMRAVRFAAALGFTIESETYAALCNHARKLPIVSAERVHAELAKLLAGPGAARGLDLLLQTGLLHTFMPEAVDAADTPHPPRFHPEGDVFTHVCLMFDMLEADQDLSARATPALHLALLLHDIAKPTTFSLSDRVRFNRHAKDGALVARRICQRLRCSKAETERVAALVAHHLDFMHVREMRTARLKRLLRMEAFDQHLILHRLDCRASHGDERNATFCEDKLMVFAREEGEAALRPRRLLTGVDLIKLGYEPGPAFAGVLGALEEAQLDGTVKNRTAAEAFVRDQFRRTCGDEGAPKRSTPPGPTT